MFKYLKFEKVQAEYTVLTFNGSSDEEKGIEVFMFDTNTVAIKCEDEAQIDAIIARQEEAIQCEEISHDEFKSITTNSSQIKRCRAICKENIALTYDLADEIAMTKRADNDAQVIAYEAHRILCINKCTLLKGSMGY
jgi:hypothetical protein